MLDTGLVISEPWRSGPSCLLVGALNPAVQPVEPRRFELYCTGIQDIGEKHGPVICLSQYIPDTKGSVIDYPMSGDKKVIASSRYPDIYRPWEIPQLFAICLEDNTLAYGLPDLSPREIKHSKAALPAMLTNGHCPCCSYMVIATIAT